MSLLECAGSLDFLTPRGYQFVVDHWLASGAAVASLLPVLPNGATIVITSNGSPVLAEYNRGPGLVVLTTISMEFGDSGDPGVGEGNGFGNALRTIRVPLTASPT